jgi:hypothetical protein
MSRRAPRLPAVPVLILLVVATACSGAPRDLAPSGAASTPVVGFAPETGSAAAATVTEAASPAWETLEAGLALGTFAAPDRPAPSEFPIHVLRIDPARFRLRLLNASREEDGRPLTARRWCKDHGMVAAINASMYQQDYRSSVSLMTTPGHVNNPRLSKDRTLLAFDAKGDDVPPVMMIDRDCDDLDTLRPRYGTLVQSIRMVSCQRQNVWEQQARGWSTAAIGVDDAGRVLFIHARSRYTTHDLIEALLALPIGLERAMYAEGGPEAQLFVGQGRREYEFIGSLETGFNEGDLNPGAWPVPNVIGISRIEPSGDAPS